MKSKRTFSEDLRQFKSTKVLTLSAMLTALSVVIGILCKNFFTFNIYYRITFENLPVIFSGVLFGPFVGAVVGVCSDLVSCLCSTNPAVNPLISLGALAVGFLSGLMYHHVSFKSDSLRLALSVAFAHLIGQVAIKSVAKMIFFFMPWYGTFIGLGVSVVVGTIEFFAIKALLGNKGIGATIGKPLNK